MPNLLNIPAELQLCIYASLDNIDDALHLARTCRQMNAVFELPNNRLIIFRSIIQHSPLHKYDVCIHNGETFFANIVDTYYAHGTIPRRRHRPYYPDHQIRLGLKTPKITRTKPIPAETVWAIVCRWHAMKTLYNLYTDVRLRIKYLGSQSTYGTLLNDFNIWSAGIGHCGTIPNPLGHNVFVSPYTDEHAAYERFYRGLCLHWWLLNNLWSARIMRYRNSRIWDKMFLNNIRFRWQHVIPRSLTEKVESFEVADFVWGFLGRRIWEDRGLIDDWVRQPDNMWLWNQAIPHSMPSSQEWVLVSLEGMRYMRPGHILDLLYHVWNHGSSGVDVAWYYCQMGFFDLNYGIRDVAYQDEDENGDEDAGNDYVSDADAAAASDDDDEDVNIPTADEDEDEDDDEDLLHSSLRDIPNWVRVKLLAIELIAVGYRKDKNEPSDSEEDIWWDRYRYYRWQQGLRGRPILFPESTEDLYERIVLGPQRAKAAADAEEAAALR